LKLLIKRKGDLVDKPPNVKHYLQNQRKRPKKRSIRGGARKNIRGNCVLDSFVISSAKVLQTKPNISVKFAELFPPFNISRYLGGNTL